MNDTPYDYRAITVLALSRCFSPATEQCSGKSDRFSVFGQSRDYRQGSKIGLG